ncbi:hypothetical protein QE364_000437 [Nocardioides zeae]|uniref:Uncharacterized protein n=2 Tax=Nocardioides zeae TaxID=1457234 RepID=A0AAJ1TZ22_9ACTN|nr:hypothetical protein [Nocardioides zeae]MDQ1104489.1 hypothetical protein [Nocardioides zeae]MDR6175821.1 hypothetical protein [Nocardioides zeae]MDR6208749.1 hypothetical protein [Nocardioides zeae]
MTEHEPTAPITRRTPEEDTMQDHDPAHDPDTAPLADRPTPSGWAAGLHPVNVGHLVMGIAFLGLAGVWALLASGAADASDTRWLLPIPWLAAGAAGLAATVWRRPAR